jgi:3-hydroxyisobutyrate dehydrogenase-like beta-hydroxyacid dehydrogenase
MEALLTESLLSARHYGVESTVIDSLRNLFPAADWSTLARYMISRSLIHGRRRAEEMREVAQTVSEAGLQPHMSAACAQRQDWAASFREAASIEELEAMLDAVLNRAKAEKTSC